MRKLDGRSIVLTRPAMKGDSLGARLEALGARVYRVPAIAIEDVDDRASDALLRELRTYDWVAFTSVSGVEAGMRRLDVLGVPRSAFDSVDVAAVGPATGRSLESHGVRATAVPTRHVGVEIAGIVGPIAGRRFLLIRGDPASPALAAALRGAGGHVDEAIVYRVVPTGLRVSGDARPDRDLVLEDLDIVTFTSPSTVRAFLASLDERAAGMLAGAAVVTIGPVTTQAAREAGLDVAAEADPHTIEGMIAAVLALAEGSPPGRAT